MVEEPVFGYWVNGKNTSPIIPSMTIKMEITVDNSGRLINLSNFIIFYLFEVLVIDYFANRQP